MNCKVNFRLALLTIDIQAMRQAQIFSTIYFWSILQLLSKLTLTWSGPIYVMSRSTTFYSMILFRLPQFLVGWIRFCIWWRKPLYRFDSFCRPRFNIRKLWDGLFSGNAISKVWIYWQFWTEYLGSIGKNVFHKQCLLRSKSSQILTFNF